MEEKEFVLQWVSRLSDIINSQPGKAGEGLETAIKQAQSAFNCISELYETNKEEELRPKMITYQDFKELGFVEDFYTERILEYRGRDRGREYIEVLFNNGVESLPVEINVSSLNNNASIGEEGDMTYQNLYDAIKLVFSGEIARGGQKDISELLTKLSNIL